MYDESFPIVVEREPLTPENTPILGQPYASFREAVGETKYRAFETREYEIPPYLTETVAEAEFRNARFKYFEYFDEMYNTVPALFMLQELPNGEEIIAEVVLDNFYPEMFQVEHLYIKINDTGPVIDLTEEVPDTPVIISAGSSSFYVPGYPAEYLQFATQSPIINGVEIKFGIEPWLHEIGHLKDEMLNPDLVYGAAELASSRKRLFAIAILATLSEYIPPRAKKSLESLRTEAEFIVLGSERAASSYVQIYRDEMQKKDPAFILHGKRSDKEAPDQALNNALATYIYGFCNPQDLMDEIVRLGVEYIEPSSSRWIKELFYTSKLAEILARFTRSAISINNQLAQASKMAERALTTRQPKKWRY